MDTNTFAEQHLTFHTLLNGCHTGGDITIKGRPRPPYRR